MRVMDAKLSLFIAQTGADPALARDLLEGNEWHVENAVKVYKLMQNAALPPAGPPKNLEPKRNNLHAVTAATGGGVPGAGPAVSVSAAQKGGIVTGTVGAAQKGGIVTNSVGTTQKVGIITGNVGAAQKGGIITGNVGAAQKGGIITGNVGAAQKGGIITGNVGAAQKGGIVTGTVGAAQKGGIVTGTVGAATLPTQQAIVPASPGVNRKLKRGLSKTTENLHLVSQARDLVLNDIEETSAADPTPHFVETPDLTFVLPDLTVYSEDFRAFLHKDLIETSTLVSLEQAGRLNWWADMGACQRLLPLATTGDGNCLLHAASLGMWGFHDRLLTLRKALYTTLTSSSSKGALWRRWRWHQTQANKESGLVYSEEEWQTEWENLLKLASAKPRTTPGSNTSCCSGPVTKGLMERTIERDANNTQTEVFYESLEEFHVFVLAHVLRRPIIVVADTILKDSNGEALAPIPFGGIYLPLECNASQCHRTPLLLTYDASHFSALVAMEAETSPEEKPGLPAAIPLVDPEFKLLPIHYMVDPGTDYVWGKGHEDGDKTKQMSLQRSEERLALIRRYLDLETIPIPPGGTPVHQQNNLFVDLDLGSQPRSRSNSHSGSVDSDENNSIGSSGSAKDNGKEKEKSKVAKQMQTVAKSFGSIGKTMSKKLKKNFGSVGKTIKQEERQLQQQRDKEKRPKMLRRTSVGSVTQSTKVTSVTVELLGDKDHILCLKLSHKRMEYQEEMVRNYLLAAQERFKQDRELRRQQDVEMRLKVELRSSRELLASTNLQTDGDEVDGGGGGGGILSPRMQCINTGCEAKGSASTSYLCPSCYEKEKQQALDFERGPVAADGRPILGGAAMPLERKDTMLTCGKSKFYTMSEDDHYGNVSHVNLAAKQLQHPPLPSKRDTLDTELNNAKLLRDKKNSYINAAGGLRVARSTFYEDVPPEYKTIAAASTATTTTINSSTTSSSSSAAAPSAAPGQPGLPAGTAYIVNDLHHQPQSHITVTQPANDRLFGRVTSVVDPTLEPPLRPEFQEFNGLVKQQHQLEQQLQQQQKQQQFKCSTKLDDAPVKSVVGGGPSGTLPLTGNRQRCRTINCPFYGTDASDFLCSACYRKKQQQGLNQMAAKTQSMR